MAKPNVKALAHQYEAAGARISVCTLYRWGRRFGWRQRLFTSKPDTRSCSPNQLMADLNAEAEHMTAGLVGGLQYRLVLHMANQLRGLKLEDARDFDRMVTVIEKLDAIIHRRRGEAITARSDRPIKLAEFRMRGPESE